MKLSIDREPTGHWNQRAPKFLHRRLVERAQAEGCSLNTLVVSLLSVSVGTARGASSATAHDRDDVAA
jgi:predicted HicB family RNase H-like nuclease